MIEKTYKIGRNLDNDIVINDAKVSRYHCVITKISIHTYLIEDIDSAGGTYVNDIKTKRDIVTKNDSIRLASFVFDWALLDNNKETPKPQFISESDKISLKPKMDNDYTQEFLALKEIYEGYKTARLAIMRGSTIKSTAIRAGLALIPIIGVPLGMILSSNSTNMQEKIMALMEELKINYICPKCKTFLGDMPWEYLANKKSCHCKAIWVKET